MQLHYTTENTSEYIFNLREKYFSKYLHRKSCHMDLNRVDFLGNCQSSEFQNEPLKNVFWGTTVYMSHIKIFSSHSSSKFSTFSEEPNCTIPGLVYLHIYSPLSISLRQVYLDKYMHWKGFREEAMGEPYGIMWIYFRCASGVISKYLQRKLVALSPDSFVWVYIRGDLKLWVKWN